MPTVPATTPSEKRSAITGAHQVAVLVVEHVGSTAVEPADGEEEDEGRRPQEKEPHRHATDLHVDQRRDGEQREWQSSDDADEGDQAGGRDHQLKPDQLSQIDLLGGVPAGLSSDRLRGAPADAAGPPDDQVRSACMSSGTSAATGIEMPSGKTSSTGPFSCGWSSSARLRLAT